MRYTKLGKGLACGALLSGLLMVGTGAYAEDNYPPDYKPSKPAEKGDTNVLARLAPIATYMTDKLNAASGKDSPMCYRNCLTVSYNEMLKCLEIKNSYAVSESCEKEAAQKMYVCDPKCK